MGHNMLRSTVPVNSHNNVILAYRLVIQGFKSCVRYFKMLLMQLLMHSLWLETMLRCAHMTSSFKNAINLILSMLLRDTLC